MSSYPPLQRHDVHLNTVLQDSGLFTSYELLRELVRQPTDTALEDHGDRAHMIAVFCVMEVRQAVNTLIQEEIQENRTQCRGEKMRHHILAELIPYEHHLRYCMAQPIIEPRHDRDRTDLDRELDAYAKVLHAWAVQESGDPVLRKKLFRLSVDDSSSERDIMQQLAEARLLTREAVETVCCFEDVIDWNVYHYPSSVIRKKHQQVSHATLWPYKFNGKVTAQQHRC